MKKILGLLIALAIGIPAYASITVSPTRIEINANKIKNNYATTAIEVRGVQDKAIRYRAYTGYFEIDDKILVHSWIPTLTDDCLPPYYIRNRNFEYNPEWKNASLSDWDDATWGNPFVMAYRGLNKTGKTIVFGHWHCSTGWSKAENRTEFGEDAKFEPFYGDGIIGIDACVAHSGKINCIAIEE